VRFIYNILTAKSIDELIEKVNALSGQGWNINGGVSYSSRHKVYMQSVINLNPPNDDVKHLENETAANASMPEPVENLSEEPQKKWDTKFWVFLNKELSNEALIFISQKNIRSSDELLSVMNERWFNEAAGKKIMEELNRKFPRKN
jgi:hypothetical protein